MPRLLVVHHTPSPALQEMLEAAVNGARTDEIEGVEVVIRPALTAAVVDVLEADAYLLGTPANIGYMSGALKHFFDGIYYPCLEATRRRPYGLYVHGGMDTTGAVRAVESITTGLAWRAIRPPVIVDRARPASADLEACWELGRAARGRGGIVAALSLTWASVMLARCRFFRRRRRHAGSTGRPARGSRSPISRRRRVACASRGRQRLSRTPGPGW